MKTQRNFLLLLIIFLHSTGLSHSQIIPEWVSTVPWNFPTRYVQEDMSVRPNGDVYILGFSQDTSNIKKTILLKYNSLGILQWSTPYDRTAAGSKLAVDSNSNIYVVGTKSWQTTQMYLAKFDSSGTFIWETFYNDGPHWNYGLDILIDHAGNIITTGITKGQIFTTLKYDPASNLLWSAFDSSANGDAHSKITIDGQNNIYLLVRSAATSWRSSLFKYNSSGNKLWENHYLGNMTSNATHPVDAIYKNGYIYILATTIDYVNNKGGIAVVKYDTVGNIVWETLYENPLTYISSMGMEIDLQNNIYVIGHIESGSCYYDAIVTLRISSSGIVLWARPYNSFSCGTTSPRDIIIDGQGFVYITGEIGDNNAFENYITIKYDSLGNELFATRYNNGNNSETANSIGLDGLGNIYISGTSQGTSQSSSIITLKYSYLTNIEGNNDELNNISIYPNPLTNYLKIQSKIDLTGGVLKIYDVMGREIVKKELVGQSSHISLDGILTGIYFYEIFKESAVLSIGKLLAQ